MKNKMIVAVSATTLTLFSATMMADDLSNTNNSTYPNSNPSSYSRDRDDAQYHRAHRNMGELRKADHIIGMSVKNDAGETIGKVKDLALDLQNGRIVSVIVASGGVLGVDRKLVAVPPSLFTLDEANKTLQTSLDKTRLQNAPEFRAEDWKNSTGDTQIKESYHYYGVPTYYGAVAQSDDDAINRVDAANSPVGNGKARDASGQPNSTTASVNAAADAAANADNQVNTRGQIASANADSSTNLASRSDVRDYASNNLTNNYNASLGNGKARDINGNYTTNLPDGSVVMMNNGRSVTPYANPSQEGNLKAREAAGQYPNGRYDGPTYYSFHSYDGNSTNNLEYYHSASYYDRQHPQNIGEVVRGSKVIGSTVYNSQNEKLGKVENLVVDLQSGRIVEIVLESGGFLGINDQYTAVPPQSIQYNADDSRVTMDVTRDSLQSSPHFHNRDWDTANQPDRINDVYRNYHVEPYFTTDNADNTARNVRDRSGDTLTPLDQGNNKADIQTTAQIRKAVLKISDLSTDGRNVKIITRDGHVTLRGVVRTAEEKREVLDAAKSIANNNQVDDQLDVKGATPLFNGLSQIMAEP